MRIRLAPQARTDLDEIWLYTAQESDDAPAATREIESIAERFKLLARHPFLGKSLEAQQRPNVRTFVAGNYLIFYSPKSDELRILRVLHVSRAAYAVFAQG